MCSNLQMCKMDVSITKKKENYDDKSYPLTHMLHIGQFLSLFEVASWNPRPHHGP